MQEPAALPMQQQLLLPGICSLPCQAAALPWCTGSGGVPSAAAHARHGCAATRGGKPGIGPCHARLYTPGAEVARGGRSKMPLAGLAASAQATQDAGFRAVSVERRVASAAAAEAAALELSDPERQAVVDRLQQKLSERGLASPEPDSSQPGGAGVLPAGPGGVAAAARKLCGYMKAAVLRGNAAGAAQLFDPALLLQVRILMVTM